MNRKAFLHNTIKAAAAYSVASTGMAQAANKLQAAYSKQLKALQLSILHTNDVHSRLDPFPMDGGKYQGLGVLQLVQVCCKKFAPKSKIFYC
jgi:5'-nucleotidase